MQPEGFPALPETWVSEWETFPASCGKLQLFAVTHHSMDWATDRAKDGAKGRASSSERHRSLMVFHGLGEHGGRYLHFPHYMKSVVDSVFCLDHRGHGRSEGLRGDAQNFNYFASDVVLAINRFDESLRKRFGRSEIHVLAHSFGGLVTLDALFSKPDLPVKSVTISAPLLEVKVPVPVVKKAAALALSRLWGTLQMTSELDASVLSHDPAVAEAYRADRLVHGKVTPRFYAGLVKKMASIQRRSSGFNYPIQVIVPLQDQVVNPDPALKFFRALKVRDKQLRSYAGFYHESFNEIEKEKAFEDLKSWIVEHS